MYRLTIIARKLSLGCAADEVDGELVQGVLRILAVPAPHQLQQTSLVVSATCRWARQCRATKSMGAAQLQAVGVAGARHICSAELLL